MEDAAVDLLATDEVHFHQHGSRCGLEAAPKGRNEAGVRLRFDVISAIAHQASKTE